MVFSSALFLFAFLPAVVGVYFCVPPRFRHARNMVLLVFSLIFYAVGEPKGLWVMLASITGNYLFAAGMIKRGGGRRKWLLILSVVFNVGLLAFYKYTGFLLDNLGLLFPVSVSVPEIIMPIGISFFTFQGMSYVFDVFQGKCAVQRNVLYVGTYISLFPQLVAGPIVRYTDIERELTERRETLERVSEGAGRLIVGLAKKLLLADILGQAANELLGRGAELLSPSSAWLGVICFDLQIFLDFSAYSDMAIGMGLIFGFRFLENFNYPYISRSVTEFWTRWHMSLSLWFRDYVYIPLGGNRRGLPRQLLNMLIVWLLTGLWHGAAWNFVLWGLYYFIWLALEKIVLSVSRGRWKPAGRLYALPVCLLGMSFMYFNDLPSLGAALGCMFGLTPGQGVPGETLFWLREYGVVLIVGIVACTPAVKLLSERFLRRGKVMPVLRYAGLISLLLVCVMRVIGASFSPFIYFRF